MHTGQVAISKIKLLKDMSRTQFKRLLRNPCGKHLAVNVTLARSSLVKTKEGDPALYCLEVKDRETLWTRSQNQHKQIAETETLWHSSVKWEALYRWEAIHRSVSSATKRAHGNYHPEVECGQQEGACSWERQWKSGGCISCSKARCFGMTCRGRREVSFKGQE